MCKKEGNTEYTRYLGTKYITISKVLEEIKETEK